MKRRNFLGRLLAGTAALPVVASVKAAAKPAMPETGRPRSWAPNEHLLEPGSVIESDYEEAVERAQSWQSDMRAFLDKVRLQRKGFPSMAEWDGSPEIWQRAWANVPKYFWRYPIYLKPHSTGPHKAEPWRITLQWEPHPEAHAQVCHLVAWNFEHLAWPMINTLFNLARRPPRMLTDRDAQTPDAYSWKLFRLMNWKKHTRPVWVRGYLTGQWRDVDLVGIDWSEFMPMPRLEGLELSLPRKWEGPPRLHITAAFEPQDQSWVQDDRPEGLQIDSWQWNTYESGVNSDDMKHIIETKHEWPTPGLTEWRVNY